MLDRVLFVLVLIIMGVATYLTDWSELSRWSVNVDSVIKQVVYGLMLSVGIGIIFLLKALWRKYVHKTPVQRL